MTTPVPPGESNFAGTFGDGPLEPYTEGQSNIITFALDGTFRRNYTDHRRGASYGATERSGGCDLDATGKYARDGEDVTCTVAVTGIGLMHDWMLDDFVALPGVCHFKEGCTFTGRLTPEGTFAVPCDGGELVVFGGGAGRVEFAPPPRKPPKSARKMSPPPHPDGGGVAAAAAAAAAAPPAPPAEKEKKKEDDGEHRRCGPDTICGRHGTGEVVHVLSFAALPGKVAEFEAVVHCLSHQFYHLTAGITDVRVCHPVCGQIVFVLTFLARPDLERFRAGPQADALAALRGLVEGGGPDFARSGTLLPDTHTLASLLKFLRANVRGASHADHDVRHVARECAKWFPRREEYEPFVHWNAHNPSAYTRNLVFGNAHMDVLLMCWPPNSVSSIHGHDDSSCWVVLVAGEVWEVQYAVPKVCKKFMQEQMRNPTGAVGRCGPLKVTGESKLAAGNGGVTTAYANNDIALHRVENRTDAPAYTLHIYAPGLRKIKLFRECGEVSVCTVSAAPITSAFGKLTGEVGKHTHPDGVLDVEAWNANQCGRGGTGGSRS